MKVVIINKSENNGGAAVVSRRLVEALRQEGVDAQMLVVESAECQVPSAEDQVTGKEVTVCQFESKWLIKYKFLLERLKIFIANGFNRETLFKIDTGSDGLPLWKHPLVKEADAVLINWVNQGMLSLKGFRKILEMGKPVIWTMHDMWEMTGICHHAGCCSHFEKECGNCPLLGKKGSPTDLSHKIWQRKKNIYTDSALMKKAAFVAVSSWLEGKAGQSSLLRDQKVEVIPNAFRVPGAECQVSSVESQVSRARCRVPMDGGDSYERRDISTSDLRTGKEGKRKIRILFGAARLDDPIKGLDTLKEMARILKQDYPDIAADMEIAMFGRIKNKEVLNDFALPLVQLGVLKGEEAVRAAYETSDILVSASSYETLPGTLVEAQAYGCIPVSFNQGGQRDIVEHLSTGYIADYDDNPANRALNLVLGIVWATSRIKDEDIRLSILSRMRKNVEEKFSYSRVAQRYIELINNLMQ